MAKAKNESQASVAINLVEAVLKQPDSKGAMAGIEDTGKTYSTNPVLRTLQQIGDWKVNTLSSIDFWDMLDGGKSTYDGYFVNMMFEKTKRQKEIAVKMSAVRRLELEEKMEELGISYIDLAAEIKDQVDDIQLQRRGGQKWTRSDIIGMFMLARSPKGLDALMNGTLQTDNPQVLNRFLAQLNEQDIAIAEHLINDMEVNFERINEGVRNATGSGMLKEDLYVTLFRVELEGRNDLAEISEKLGIAPPTSGTMSTNRGFTKDKINIKGEHQTGVATNALSVWANHVHSTEYTAAMGKHVMDMATVLDTKMSDIFRHLDDSGIKYNKSLLDELKSNNDQNRTIGQMITRRFGKGAKHAADSFIKRAAMDGLGYAYSILDKYVDIITKNIQIQALAGAMGFFVSNLSSFPQFAPRSGYIGATVRNLILTLGTGMSNPNEIIKRVREMSPEMKERKQHLEWGALYKSYENDHTRYGEIMRKGIDICVSSQTWIEAIGFMATYQSNIDDGLSHEDAVMYARKTVLIRQPAGSAADTPVMYAESKMLRFLNMFTGDLNSKWRIITNEIPNNIKRGEITVSGGLLLSVASTMILFTLIRNGLPKEDETYPEWLGKSLAMQSVEVLPIVGKPALAAIDMLQGKFRETDPLGAPVKKTLMGIGQVGFGFHEDDTEKMKSGAIRALEGITTFTKEGLPMRALSTLYKTGIAGKEGRYMDAINAFMGRNIKSESENKKYLKPQY